MTESCRSLSAFAPVSEARLRESSGLWFEEFASGQTFLHRPGVTVSQEANAREAMLTMNQAMIHFDDRYAAASEFRRPLVVSTLTLQYAVGLCWKTFGRRRNILGFSNIRLTAPVFGGDTLYARSCILATDDIAADAACGAVTAEISLEKFDGQKVAEIGCRIAIYRRAMASPLPASFGT